MATHWHIYFYVFVSDNVERREIEKERLQHELRECDDKLNRQVESESYRPVKTHFSNLNCSSVLLDNTDE